MATGLIPKQETHQAEAAGKDEGNQGLHPALPVPSQSRVYPPRYSDKIPEGLSVHRAKG